MIGFERNIDAQMRVFTVAHTARLTLYWHEEPKGFLEMAAGQGFNLYLIQKVASAKSWQLQCDIQWNYLRTYIDGRAFQKHCSLLCAILPYKASYSNNGLLKTVWFLLRSQPEVLLLFRLFQGFFRVSIYFSSKNRLHIANVLLAATENPFPNLKILSWRSDN